MPPIRQRVAAAPDVITATAAVASANLTATGTVTVAAAVDRLDPVRIGHPPRIGLKGTGLNETSTVVFKVVDSSGGARPGVTVSFSLNTNRRRIESYRRPSRHRPPTVRCKPS